MKKNFYTLIFAQNYVTYHSSMYSEFFKKSKRKSIVIYEDISGKSDKIEQRWNNKLNWGIDITKGFKSILIKNFSKNPHSSGLFSRFNPQIPLVISKIKPKKIFFQGYSDLSSWLILISSILFRVKSIHWKGERVLKDDENISIIKKIILKYFFFNFCSRIYYSCKGNLEYLNKFQLPKEKLYPMNCSVNNNYFSLKYKLNKNKKNLLKMKYNIKTEDRVILLVTNFEKRKNIKSLLNIVPFFKEKNYKFLIVGDGNYKNDIEIFNRIFRKKIILSGFVDIKKISDYYSISDLFVLLSSYDPSPKTLNEAMNFGLPCIVSKQVGTSKDLIKNGINGYVLKNTNKNKVLNYVKRIFLDQNIKIKSYIYNNSKLKFYSPIQNANILFKN